MQKINLTIIGIIMILMLVACGDSREDKGSSELATNPEGFKSTEETYNSTETLTEEINTTTEMTQEPTEEETTEAPETELSTEPVTENETFVGEVDPEYANLKKSEGFLFTSNGNGTCTLVEVGNCEDKKIVIPAISPQGEKVTKIGEGAFYYADDAEEVIFAGLSMELDKNAFSSCNLEKVVITGCDLIVGENVFSYCDKIEAVYISNSQIELNEYAFYDVGDDAALTIKNTTGQIGETAFQSTSFQSVNIVDCELEIGDNAFAYNEDIETLVISGGSLEIGEYAFYDCGKKMDVKISGTKISIEDNGFQSSEIILLTVEECELVIGDNAFAYCEDLSEIVFDVDSIEIGEYAFYDCTELGKVSVKVKENSREAVIIEDNAFQSCDAVVEVVIEGGVVEIGTSAFAYCEKLERVQLNCDSVDVGRDAFYDCADGLLITYKGVTYTAESIEEAK